LNFIEKKVYFIVRNYDTYSFKALYFDLHTKSLSQHYSISNPNGGYSEIKDFLTNHNFTHEQYSGYHSNFKTTDMRIFRLIKLMKTEMPWLSECLSKFAVMDVGENYNLMKLMTADPAVLT